MIVTGIPTECPRCRTVPRMDDACACAWRDRHVGQYKSRYSGRVAILCGGTTAAEQDLSRITCPILGVNESWRAMPYPRTFAHVLSDWAGAARYGAEVVQRWPDMPVFQKIFADGKMLVPGAIPIRKGAEHFSFDLAVSAWTICAPVLSLQLAVYMGFTDIVFIGLDLKRRGAKWHWWDDMPNPHNAAPQWAIQRVALSACAQVLGKERPRVRVTNVSHDTRCDAFGLRKFSEVFA